MCVVSMAYDHWKEYPWPDLPVNIPVQPIFPTITWTTGLDVDKLAKAIEDFRKTIEAAKVVDKLTGQPDCADPKKAELEERVNKLEKALLQKTLEQEVEDFRVNIAKTTEFYVRDYKDAFAVAYQQAKRVNELNEQVNELMIRIRSLE